MVLVCLVSVAALCCGLPGRVAPACAQAAFPALSGRVVDMAGVLDPVCAQKLTEKLAQWDKKTGDQLVVVTIASLAGGDIESFANRLFRQWALGEAKINNGVLLVVAPGDRQVRIEVGYGLEQTLTDALSSVIIHTWLVPAFREGNYCLGVSEGAQAILSVLAGDKAGFEARVRDKRAADKAQAAREDRIASILGMVVTGIIVFMFAAPLLAAVFGKRIGPNRYLWLGIVFTCSSSGAGGGGFGNGGLGGGGFGSGGGSSGGGGASGRW